MSLLKKSPARTIALNMLAELFGAAIFSLLFLLLVGRYASPRFEMGFLTLVFAIGAAFFAAVFIPFHTYRIHILPYITVVAALRKRQWRIIWHKIPAQLAGSVLGVVMYIGLNSLSPMAPYSKLATMQVPGSVSLALVNGLTAVAICVMFLLIRMVFKQRRSTGTMLIAIVLSSLFLLLGRVEGVSVFNPFALMGLQLLSGEQLFTGGWIALMLVHVLVPVSFSALAYYAFDAMYGRKTTVRLRPELTQRA